MAGAAAIADVTATLIVGITDDALVLAEVAQRLRVDPETVHTARDGTRVLSIGRGWVEDPPVPVQAQLAEVVGLVADRQAAIRELVDAGSALAKADLGIQSDGPVRIVLDPWQSRVLAGGRVGFGPTFYAGEVEPGRPGPAAGEATVDLMVVADLEADDISRRLSLEPRAVATTGREWVVWRHGADWTKDPPVRAQLDAAIAVTASRAAQLRALHDDGAFVAVTVAAAQADTHISLWIDRDQLDALASAGAALDLAFVPVPGS